MESLINCWRMVSKSKVVKKYIFGPEVVFFYQINTVLELNCRGVENEVKKKTWGGGAKRKFMSVAKDIVGGR